MPRKIHKRTDLQYTIVKGKPSFSRVAYACVITQATACPDERSIYHIETFYGADGVKIRAEARRYGSAIVRGFRLPSGFREQYLPHNFSSEGLPKPPRLLSITTVSTRSALA
jgi:hypothetical protein